MKTKSAFVAIVGEPNVGKSSLLNRLVGEKVAIVTPKPQTTRNRITGILTENEIQYVFIDTPGMHTPKNHLSTFMVKQVKESLAGVEVALLLTEPTGEITPSEQELLDNLLLRKIPVILVLNKVDTLKGKELMMPKIKAFSDVFSFAHIIPLSALTGEGTIELLALLSGYAVESPHFFDADSYTDQPERVIVAEIVREKLLLYLREELPHGIAVDVEQMKERESKDMLDLSVVIFCEKDSHKGMIIGKKGAMLKKIASHAREDIQRFLDVPINLQCWVKVRENWRDRPRDLSDLGFSS